MGIADRGIWTGGEERVSSHGDAEIRAGAWATQVRVMLLYMYMEHIMLSNKPN